MKIKSPRQKGNRVACKCKITLENEGWTVADVEKTGKFVKVKDLYGLFDLLCIKPCNILFVQVKSNKAQNHPLYQNFVNEYCLVDNMMVEQWVWKDYQGFTKYVYKPYKKYEKVKINIKYSRNYKKVVKDGSGYI